jgi:hypothetical protein
MCETSLPHRQNNPLGACDKNQASADSDDIQVVTLSPIWANPLNWADGLFSQDKDGNLCLHPAAEFDEDDVAAVQRIVNSNCDMKSLV